MIDLQISDDSLNFLQEGDVATASSPLKLAQGVFCGSLPLAFSFDWARQIVDQFELVPIPRSPGWMLGAVNINGLVIPVINLENYFSAAALPTQIERGQRLLLGGLQAEDSDSAFAIVFNRIPIQLEYQPELLPVPSDISLRLNEVCTGMARDDQGQTFFEIDPPLLMDALLVELSLI